MEFSDLDLPDYRDDLESDDSFRPPARDALLTAMLECVDTNAVAAALTMTTPQVVLIKAPTADWAKAIADLVGKTYNQTYATAIVDLKKDGNASTTNDVQRRLASGRHIVLVSQDPASMLPPATAGAVDVRLDLPNPTLKMVAAAIKQVTGQRATGLKLADITGLDFGELELALRDESRARDCVQRLRRAAASAALPLVPPGPRVEDLPLTGAVSAWTIALLAQLRQVEAGTLAPAALAYPLLEGPPGVGKTLLAAAMARSAGWRLVSTSVGSWFASSDGHLGGVIRAATGFVDDVLSHERTIGLIDEIDALPDRAVLDAKDREWWTPVVAQVLLQIDRVRKSNRQALLIGATNFYDRLDGALIRSGRLEQRVSILPPQTVEEVARVLRHYLDSDLDTATLDMAARMGIGATPATIEGWCRAARAKARAEARALRPGDLIDAVAPADDRSPDETRAVAIHEAGHVAVARHLGVVVLGVSILANGRSGGHTLTETASRFPNRLELEIMATILLGGRAADLTLGKGGHTGAEHDLAMATRMISDGITQFGLYDTLARPSDDVLGKGALFTQIDLILKRLLRSAIAIIVAETGPIQRLTERLIEERVMNGDAIAAIWAAPGGDGA